ncbi:DNA-binding domain-containing protein [Pseudomonas solani]|uniref:HvfC family RiPP maturation protein n=1 Tax=Pseudomonas solani TaxID=2731552 RepID=UPI003C2FCA35
MADALHAQLLSLAHHVRDPQRFAPPPGIEARRLAVYRQLFFGNVEGLLAGGFPVLRASLGDTQWPGLVRAFYAGHPCRTPLFAELAGEFVAFLEAGGGDDLGLPWLAELAHYEWVESALLLSDLQEPEHDPAGDLRDGVPLLSALAWPLAYAWPVSEIAPGFLPQHAPEQPTLLLARRGADQQVHFSRLAPLAHALLMSLQARECSGLQHVQLLAEAIGVDVETLLPQGLALLERLREQGVVIGTRLQR